MEKNNSVSDKNTISGIFGALRKNWLLIVISLVVFAIAGGIYLSLQKPIYTAKNKAFYTAHNIVVDNDNSAEHVNAARVYIDTVVDFCNEENTVKRADYYYGRYLAEKELNPDLTVEQFLQTLNQEKKTYTDFNQLMQFVGGERLDVFYTVHAVENKREVEKTFVFSGTIIIQDNSIVEEDEGLDKIIITHAGETFEVLRKDFLYARVSDTYMSEYSFLNLDLISQGQTVKVFTYEDVKHLKPIEKVGVFKGYDDTGVTIEVDGQDVTILREDFKKLTLVLPSYFNANAISVEYEKSIVSNEENFILTIGYADANQQIARDKVRFVINAIDTEAKLYAIDELEPVEAKFTFFKNVEVTISDADFDGYSSSVSTIKTMFVFLAIGIAVGVLTAYLKELFDNTIKTKDELEALTGVKMLSAIPVEEGK